MSVAELVRREAAPKPRQRERNASSISGYESGPPMPVIAHMICQSCGAGCEAVAPPHRVSVTLCPCGGTRQVVRVVRHPHVEASASSLELERKVQARATDETLTP